MSSNDKQLQCLLCGRDIEILEQFAEGDFLLNDAGFVNIDFGYGSGFDNDRASAFICDECFASDVVRARLHSHYSYDEECAEYNKEQTHPTIFPECISSL